MHKYSFFKDSRMNDYGVKGVGKLKKLACTKRVWECLLEWFNQIEQGLCRWQFLPY